MQIPFDKIKSRLMPEAIVALKTLLASSERMSKEELSLSARVKRAVLDKALIQLHAVCFVDINSFGRSKVCNVTQLGKQFADWLAEGENGR